MTYSHRVRSMAGAIPISLVASVRRRLDISAKSLTFSTIPDAYPVSIGSWWPSAADWVVGLALPLGARRQAAVGVGSYSRGFKDG